MVRVTILSLYPYICFHDYPLPHDYPLLLDLSIKSYTLQVYIPACAFPTFRSPRRLSEPDIQAREGVRFEPEPVGMRRQSVLYWGDVYWRRCNLKSRIEIMCFVRGRKEIMCFLKQNLTTS